MKERTIRRLTNIMLPLLVILAMTAFLFAQIAKFEAYAIDGEEEVVAVEEVQEEEVVKPTTPLDEPEVLLEDYIEVITQEYAKDIDAVSYEAKDGIVPDRLRGNRLSGAEKNLYSLLKTEIEKVAAGSNTGGMTKFEFTFDQLFPEKELAKRYSASELGVEGIVLEGAEGLYIPENAADAILDKYTLDTAKAINALLYDCPYSLFWYDKTGGMAARANGSVTAEWANGQWVGYCVPDESKYTFYLAVSTDFAPNSYSAHIFHGIYRPIQTNTVLIKELNGAVETAISVVSAASEKSTYEKLDYYREWICNEVSYDEVASKEENNVPYGNPWQLINVFDKNNKTNVVCEGYSKAFKYLCDLSTFDEDKVSCLIATGTMIGGTGAGGHMWNIVEVGGNNYLVDVTNCDEGTAGYPDELFMVGNKTYTTETVTDHNTGKTASAEKYDFNNLNLTYYYDYAMVTSSEQSERLLAAQNYDPNNQGEDPGTGTGTEPGTDPGTGTGTGTDPGTGTGTGADPGTGTGTGTGTDPDPNPEPTPIDISEMITFDTIPNIAYTGSAIEPSVNITDFVPNRDYTVSYKNNINVGTASIIITGKGNYTGTVTATFKIVAKKITPTVTLSATAYTYDGKAKAPTVTVKDGSKTLVKDKDYTISYASGRINAGTYGVTVTLKGNYSGKKTVNFKINPKSITPAVTLSAVNYTYDGKVKAPGVTVKYGSKVLKKGTDYKVTYASGRKNVGTYKVTVTLMNNYKGSKAVNFKINPKPTKIATPAAASKAITAKWSKQTAKMSAARITGYQIQTATDKNFKKNAKAYTVKGYNSASKKITGLKSKTTYYVRVRTYMKVGTVTYYSGWSAAKAVKTK